MFSKSQALFNLFFIDLDFVTLHIEHGTDLVPVPKGLTLHIEHGTDVKMGGKSY